MDDYVRIAKDLCAEDLVIHTELPLNYHVVFDDS